MGRGGTILRNSHKKGQEATGTEWESEGRRKCLLEQDREAHLRLNISFFWQSSWGCSHAPEASLGAKMHQAMMEEGQAAEVRTPQWTGPRP